MATNNSAQTSIEEIYKTIEQSLKPDDHAVYTEINEWERHSIGKIQLAAEQARNDLKQWFDKKREDVGRFLVHVYSQLGRTSTATDIDLTKLNNEIRRFRESLRDVKSSTHLEHDKTKVPIHLIQLDPQLNATAKENTDEEKIDVPGTRLLTLPIIRSLPPVEQKQMLGERLFVLVQQIEPTWAAKITGMFLEWDTRYILMLIQSHAVLREKVKHAIQVLNVHHYRQRYVTES